MRKKGFEGDVGGHSLGNVVSVSIKRLVEGVMEIEEKQT